MLSYKVAAMHNLGSATQKDTKGKFPASVFPLDDCVPETHTHTKMRNPKKCRLHFGTEKVSENSFCFVLFWCFFSHKLSADDTFR